MATKSPPSAPTISAAERAATVDVAAIEEVAAGRSKGAAVSAASPALRGKTRRHLRSLGNTLRAVVHVGHGGCTPALASQLDAALSDHELIKVKVLETCPQSMPALMQWCHEVLGAQVPQWLGHTVLIYRAHPTEPRIRLPKTI
jgi:RNA-binding protein